MFSNIFQNWIHPKSKSFYCEKQSIQVLLYQFCSVLFIYWIQMWYGGAPMGNTVLGSEPKPKPIIRGERRHRFPIARDAYANCSHIECACCGKNLRTCNCTCNLTGRCLCAGPLNYHRHDFVSGQVGGYRFQSKI